MFIASIWKPGSSFKHGLDVADGNQVKFKMCKLNVAGGN